MNFIHASESDHLPFYEIIVSEKRQKRFVYYVFYSIPLSKLITYLEAKHGEYDDGKNGFVLFIRKEVKGKDELTDDNLTPLLVNEENTTSSVHDIMPLSRFEDKYFLEEVEEDEAPFFCSLETFKPNASNTTIPEGSFLVPSKEGIASYAHPGRGEDFPDKFFHVTCKGHGYYAHGDIPINDLYKSIFSRCGVAISSKREIQLSIDNEHHLLLPKESKKTISAFINSEKKTNEKLKKLQISSLSYKELKRKKGKMPPVLVKALSQSENRKKKKDLLELYAKPIAEDSCQHIFYHIKSEISLHIGKRKKTKKRI